MTTTVLRGWARAQADLTAVSLVVAYVCPSRTKAQVTWAQVGTKGCWLVAMSSRLGHSWLWALPNSWSVKALKQNTSRHRLSEGSDPGQHLFSALPPQLRSTLALESLLKPQPVPKKLPTSSRCPTMCSTCGARLLSFEGTSMRPGDGMKKPYPSAPPM